MNRREILSALAALPGLAFLKKPGPPKYKGVELEHHEDMAADPPRTQSNILHGGFNRQVLMVWDGPGKLRKGEEVCLVLSDRMTVGFPESNYSHVVRAGDPRGTLLTGSWRFFAREGGKRGAQVLCDMDMGPRPDQGAWKQHLDGSWTHVYMEADA